MPRKRKAAKQSGGSKKARTQGELKELTSEQRDTLLKAVEEHGKKWTMIAEKYFKGTDLDRNALRNHYTQLKKEEKKDVPNTVLERGNIYFFYRQKVDAEHVKDASDVQRLYMILVPHARVDAQKNLKDEENLTKKLLIITSKKLPIAKTHTRHWAFVEDVDKNIEHLHNKLEKKQYETKTKGERELKAAVPCGEGLYEIIEHGSRGDTALAYVLEIPHKPGEVQKAFNIGKEEAYVIMVKNPTIQSRPHGEPAPGLQSKQKTQYPNELMEKFKGIRKAQVRFAPCNPPDFLDYEHCEIVMIGMTENLREEFGKVGKELEEEEKAEEAKEKPGKEHEKVFKELGIKDKEEHPIQPLQKGTWA